MKHLRKTPEKHLKTIANIYNIQMKHLQKYVRKHLKTLETNACNMHACATSRSIFATTKQNTCNIRLEQMKYLEHTLATRI
jgi:hypothetical protein